MSFPRGSKSGAPRTSRSHRPRALLLATSAGLVLAGCPAEPAQPAVPTGPNVLVIAIDTLRADALAAQGGTAGVSPRIDALAAEGVRFSAAFAHAPWTLPSFSSLFTSLPPEAHGAGGNVREGWRALSADHTTIAEQFQDAGWTTHAIVNVDFLTEPFGTTQGFQVVDAHATNDNHTSRRAGATTDAALQWLDEKRSDTDGARPFFLFVHYFDPHAEYDPPPAWRAKFALEQDRSSTAFRFGAREHVVNHRGGRMPLDATTLARARALYDGEIAYTDDEIGRLLAGLRARGLDPNTIVVLTSDHGEEFGEHGSWEHGHTHFDELLHVPLVIRAPGVAPRTRDEPVGLVDVAPTLCALAGVPSAPSFRGRDLSRALVAGDELPAFTGLAAYGNFWGAAIESWRGARWKRIDSGTNTQLYDWILDPHERSDRAANEAQTVQDSRAESLEYLRRLDAVPPKRGPTATADDRARERLNKYGYTGGEQDH